MVPPIVAVVQGLPSLIYICERRHSHLRAFVPYRIVRVSDTVAVTTMRAFRTTFTMPLKLSQWRGVLQKDVVVNIETDFF